MKADAANAQAASQPGTTERNLKIEIGLFNGAGYKESGSTQKCDKNAIEIRDGRAATVPGRHACLRIIARLMHSPHDFVDKSKDPLNSCSTTPDRAR